MGQKRARRLVSFTLGSAIFLSLFPVLAKSAAPERASAGPYCGLYCVYAALKAVGKEVDFESILQPKYLSQRQGSSIGELRAAAVAAGAHAIGLSGLGVESLRTAQNPMILHFASDGQLRQYNHWVLFCGMEAGRARILDAPNPMETVPVSEIMCRWNGTALVVSPTPIGENTVSAGEYAFQLNVILLAFSIVYLGDRCLRRRGSSTGTGRFIRFRPAVSQAVLLVFCSLLMGALLHWSDEPGFLRSPGAANYVAAANMSRFFPRLSYTQMKRFVDAREGTIIDARFPDSYGMGHIPGAINVPIDSSAPERRQRLTGIARSSPIVVYCQSTHCEYDELVASLLARDGLESISLYPGGWAEWDEYEHSKSDHRR